MNRPKTSATIQSVSYMKRSFILLTTTLGVVLASESATLKDLFTTVQRKHWSFQKVSPPAVPVVKNSAWVRNPIDAFILAKLESKAIRPSPRRRQDHVAAPGQLRPGRFAADAGGGGCLPRRQITRRFREGGGPAAGFAPLRRALGAPLAGPGPICRKRRLQERRNPAERLALSRLRHPIVQ